MVDDDDGDGFPSPKPRTDSRSALPRGFRAWRRLRIVKRDFFSLIFFTRNSIYGVGVGVEGPPGGPRGRGRAQGGGARLPPSWTGCGPPGLHLWRGFFIIYSKIFRGVSGPSENFYFLHKNNIMAILFRTTSVWVSSIHIIQVSIQNKGKSVWKSRYDGDISRAPIAA